jgi:hypothetical protein
LTRSCAIRASGRATVDGAPIGRGRTPTGAGCGNIFVRIDEIDADFIDTRS